MADKSPYYRKHPLIPETPYKPVERLEGESDEEYQARALERLRAAVSPYDYPQDEGKPYKPESPHLQGLEGVDIDS